MWLNIWNISIILISLSMAVMFNVQDQITPRIDDFVLRSVTNFSSCPLYKFSPTVWCQKILENTEMNANSNNNDNICIKDSKGQWTEDKQYRIYRRQQYGCGFLQTISCYIIGVCYTWIWIKWGFCGKLTAGIWSRKWSVCACAGEGKSNEHTRGTSGAGIVFVIFKLNVNRITQTSQSKSPNVRKCKRGI